MFIAINIFPTGIAFAAGNAIETSDVLADLKSAETFDIADFPENPLGKLKVINFVEYGFAYDEANRGSYALFLYIYNPAKIDIEAESAQNKVEMAISYNADGEPIKYEKYEIKFINASADKLFFKYKITNGNTFSARVNKDARRYDVSGIELKTAGKTNATEYKVGGRYVFTGFEKGLGATSEESTLKCNVTQLETLKLNVGQTTFRTNMSELGANHYNQVSSVYFSIPNDVLEEYGYLNRVSAEWWEYKTAPMVVTANQDFYRQLSRYTGADTGGFNSSIPLALYAGHSHSSITSGAPPFVNSRDYTSFDWSYNIKLYRNEGWNSLTVVSSAATNNILPYAFYSPKITGLEKVFNFINKKRPAGDVAGNEVANYIYNYSNNLGNGYIDCNGRQISNDLFESTVDAGRTRGYNRKDILLENTFNLKSYDSNHNWFEKFLEFGFKAPETDGDYENIAPLFSLSSSDLTGKTEDVSKNLLINEEDLYYIKLAQKAVELRGETMFLCRFANTDYYSIPVGYNVNGADVSEADTDTYIASETVFLDFDIIELEFKKDGVYHVIAAVSSPTDIIGGITAPTVPELNWKVIVITILVIIALIVFFPLIIDGVKGIVKGLWWIVSAPFRKRR